MRSQRVLLAAVVSSSLALQAPRQPSTKAAQRAPGRTTSQRVATLEPPTLKKPLRLKLASPPPARDFIKEDGTLDVIPFSAQAEYELKPRQRVIGVAYVSALTALVTSSRVPAFLRLLGLQYAAYSAFEYCFHRWCMHAKYGTLLDKIFGRWNRLHVQHHIDTNDDMTMVDDYNWKGIRFNYLTSRLSVVIGSSMSWLLVKALRLDLPFWPTPLCSWLVSMYHGVLWNKLHTDSHDLQENSARRVARQQATLTWKDGVKYVDVPTGHRYARWLLTNHVGHHAVNGAGNYNIVFPGPDHLAGTFYQLKT